MKRTVMMAVAVAALVAGGPASGATTVAGAPTGGAGPTTRCADTTPSARLMEGSHAADPNTVTRAQARAMERALQARLAQLPTGSRAAAAPINVQVVWQVITRADGSGGVTNDQIARQLRAMNRGFKGLTSGSGAETPFRFTTRQVVRTPNSDWYNWTRDDDDAPAKRALHRGTAATLNVYITNLGNGLLGYATFPGGPLALDGVVVLNESLPGGSAAPYNKGDTLTHEVGHWINLFHTFQGGCVGSGDQVNDTPKQFDDSQVPGGNVYQCNDSLDTCVAPGDDPVHNFMNYVDDACMNRFTRGQSARMLNGWNAFRAR